MKIPFPLITLLALAQSAAALEHITLTGSTPTKSVSAGDLVEVVGTNKNNDGNIEFLRFTFADGASTKMALRGKESGAFDDMKGNAFTGLTSVTLELAAGGPAPDTCATLKITPADEIGSTPAGTVLVLPENSTGSYDVVIQSSDDLVNWETVVTHVVDGATSPNFFRARIIKTAAP